MTVYVDDMQAPLGRMVMCHMIGDSDDELHAMADRIGVARRWFQKPGHPQRHYDIALSKKALAVAAGAVQITRRQCAAMTGIRRLTGVLGAPQWAVDQYTALLEAREYWVEQVWLLSAVTPDASLRPFLWATWASGCSRRAGAAALLDYMGVQRP